ncbi:hypothetical protein [Rhodobacter sp. NSM]|uniref:hypothetical protein n=1 Tax=Rhodobacter sp. NSM TaxID=3457501 RepID=UPI003FD16633
MRTVRLGDVVETKTLKAMLTTVLERFPDERVILIADRCGLLCLDNSDAPTAGIHQHSCPRSLVFRLPHVIRANCAAATSAGC